MTVSKLDELITKYTERYKTLQGDLDEINERHEDGYDPSSWSGGNFDDAYEIGEEDGYTLAESKTLQRIISDLEELKGGA